jgi:uncharacterized membrane protein YjdF
MKTIIEKFNDPEKLFFEIQKRKKDVFFWIIAITIITFITIFISSQDYSFLLVLSSLTQMFAFIIVVIKVYTFQNSSGLSINTLICYALLLSARLFTNLLFSGYLPSDNSGDWFYQLTEIISLLCVLLLIYLTLIVYTETSDYTNDKVPFYYLAIPTFILACIVHTSLNGFLPTDITWCFSMYLEAVAIFPQIQLFVVKKGQIETYTSHYVALCGLSRLLSLIFWWDTYPELNTQDGNSISLFCNYCGYFIIASQVIQLLIMIDYYYLYFKSLFKGEAMNTLNI